MISNLNSTLLQGVLLEEPISTSIYPCVLEIKSSHINKTTKEISTIEVIIVCYGKLADICLERLHQGRRIRVIGRLIQHGDSPGRLVIRAEHVEFEKPIRKG